mgnify:CR=1 FL=1
MTKYKAKNQKNNSSSQSQSNSESSSHNNNSELESNQDESNESKYDSLTKTNVNNTTQSARKSRQRQENSLGELTKNFIKYIREKGNRVVHINEVVKKLKVKKRRIYDITNVLEGMTNLCFYFYICTLTF